MYMVPIWMTQTFSVRSLIYCHSDMHVIVDGDFNCVLVNLTKTLDRSAQTNQLPSAASTTLNNWMLSTHLVDILRPQHPTQGLYIFSQRQIFH